MDTDTWNPGALLGLSGGYWRICTLHAAVKLDIFTVIDQTSLTAQDIAGKIDSDGDAVVRLLDALVAMTLLIKQADKYTNTPSGQSYLSKNSPRYIGYMIMHHHHLVESWARLDQAVRQGGPVRTRASFDSPEHRESFLMGMFNTAMMTAPQIVEQIGLADRHHLLDLGGGPGTYAVHFCQKNPNLKATVYDLATTRPFALKTIERFGLSDRIGFVDGDYVNETIEGDFDAAWLSHILHGEGIKTCERIVEKTVAVLRPGGMIIIHDFILNETMDGPLFPALFSLNMLLGTESGRSYSKGRIVDMLTRAGVRDIEQTSFKGPTESGIIIGTV